MGFSRIRGLRGLVCVGVVTGLATGMASGQAVTTEDLRVASTTPGDSVNFGQALAMDGDVVVSGAPFENAPSFDSGAAYVYRFDGTTWNEEQKLTASDAASGDQFGRAVGVSGDLIVIGSESDETASGAGAAYVFRFDGTTWNEEEKLLASDGQAFDNFGWSVAVDGNRVAVGAWGDDDLGNATGSAYLFEHDGTNWQEITKFLSSNPGTFDFYGWAVDVEGDDVIVGSYNEDSVASNAGAAYVYHFDGSTWSLQQKLVPAGATTGLDAGYDVALSGDRALVGTLGDGAFVYERTGSVWAETAQIDGHDTLPFEGSGSTIDLDGDVAVISAIFHHHDGLNDSGAAYVFRYDGSNWSQLQKIISTTLDDNQYFGQGLALSGQTVVANAADTEGGEEGAGAAFFYDLPSIALDIESNTPAIGDPLTISTCGGVPGNLAMLFVLDVGGVPFTQRLFNGLFDAAGMWNVAGAVPNDVTLSGLDVTMATFSTDGGGSVVMSNQDTVSIQ